MFSDEEKTDNYILMKVFVFLLRTVFSPSVLNERIGLQIHEFSIRYVDEASGSVSEREIQILAYYIKVLFNRKHLKKERVIMSEKIALVTGASGGIGRAIAIALAETGAYVYVNYNGSQGKAEETVRLIEEKGGRAEICKFNVGDFEETNKAVAEIIAAQGRLDILVNNAGITKDGLMMMMTEEQFDAVININLKGAFNTIKAATRTMVKQRSGRIINITSVSGVMGNAGQANYSASKAGMIGLTKSMARELASRNITVNAVAPGFIETEMTAVLSDAVKEGAVKQIPVGRFGQPEDIANMVKYLASDEAAYITGQVICVDGGMAM